MKYAGVSFYTVGTCEINVNFPEREICCFHCWLRYKDSGDRQMCRLLQKEVYRIHDGIHEDCPLRFGECDFEQS